MWRRHRTQPRGRRWRGSSSAWRATSTARPRLTGWGRCARRARSATTAIPGRRWRSSPTPWRRSTISPEPRLPAPARRTPRCARSAHSLACASASCAPSRRRCRGTRPGTPSRGGRRTAWRSWRWRRRRVRSSGAWRPRRASTAAASRARSPARARRSASAPGRWAARRRRTRSGTSPPRGGAPRRAARALTTSTLKRARVHYRVSLPTRIQTWIRATRRCGSPRRSRAPRTSPPRTTPRSPPGTGTCPASSPTR